MLQILTEQNVQRSLKELRPQDILVAPDLTGVSFLDFENYARAMRAGEQAAQALAARLAPLALPPEQYAAREQLRLAAPALLDVALPLTRLAVESEGDINPRILQAQSGLEEGQSVSQEDVLKAAAKLYGAATWRAWRRKWSTRATSARSISRRSKRHGPATACAWAWKWPAISGTAIPLP